MIYYIKFTAHKSRRHAVLYGTITTAAALAVVLIVCRASVAQTLIRVLNIDGSKYDVFMKDMEVSGPYARFETSNGDFYIVTDETDTFIVTDGNGTKLTPVSSELKNNGAYADYRFDVPSVGRLALQVQESMGLLNINNFNLFIGRAATGDIAVLDLRYKTVDLYQYVARVGFRGIERFASNRGYIWSRALPLALSNFLLGSGPDTFAVAFPQHDILGKVQSFGDPYMLVDKAHNFYIQTGVTTGLFSLAALLFIFIRYIAGCLKSLLSRKMRDLPQFALLLGLFAGICGYLVCSMSTDSTVSVAPLFWAALGMGFGVKTQYDEAYKNK